jgi:two-component system sporulation sensor kinase B
MKSVIAHEFHGLLYIMSACVIFLVVTPKALYANPGRKLLFICILFVLTGFYIGTESIDPLVYALHLTPVSLALAALFEGIIPGVCTWGAFLVVGTLVVGNDPLATAGGTTSLLLAGLVFHRKLLRQSNYGQMALMSVLLVSVHLAVYLIVMTLRGFYADPSIVCVVLVGTYLSTLLVSYVYYRVKNQEHLQEELASAEKYHMIGQLAASISHEIRNPLTTAGGFLQLMGKAGIDGAARERYRINALEGIEQANAIITGFLEYSKPTVPSPKPFDLLSEIESLVSWVSPLTAVANIDLRIRHEAEGPLTIIGEPKKFQQCMLNLMKNAIDAMPQGGKLTVLTWLESGEACIRISDTGVGMNEDQLRRIGMPYFTTKEKGTGLGLMVVIGLVKVMGGKISFRSRPREGTHCDIRFKLAAADTAMNQD